MSKRWQCWAPVPRTDETPLSGTQQQGARIAKLEKELYVSKAVARSSGKSPRFSG